MEAVNVISTEQAAAVVPHRTAARTGVMPGFHVASTLAGPQLAGVAWGEYRFAENTSLSWSA